MLTSRRSLLTGLGALIAAPAVVRASSLMPVKTLVEPMPFWLVHDGKSPFQSALEPYDIFNLFAEKNALLDDLPFYGDERLPIRVSLPEASWRSLA